MKRLLLVYNRNSSQYVHVQGEVLDKVRKVPGRMVGKFTIEKVPFEENVGRLMRVLMDGDTVVVLGGDATAAVVANAIMNSEKDVTMGVLPYGNFNDLARTLGTMKRKQVFVGLGEKDNLKISENVKNLYPLEIIVDGKRWRYATCYVTMGMTAEAVELFDEPKFRAKMQEGHRSSWRSYLALAKWYFQNRHKKEFLPDFLLNGKSTKKKVSDYCALSGKSMCRVMKGGDDFLRPRIFRSENCRLTNFWRLFVLMMRAMCVRTPGSETELDELKFLKPATFEMQAEGEYNVFTNVEKVVVKKSERALKVIIGQV